MAHDPSSPSAGAALAESANESERAALPKAGVDDNHLVWIDMEMSGLHPDSDRILEIAVVVTNANLETVAEAPVIVVHQSDAVLAGMDAWNRATHGRSGLIEKVRQSGLDDAGAEDSVLAFLVQYVRAGK